MTVVIFDTNLLLDFFVFREPSTLPLWRAAELNAFTVKTTRHALAELRDVLSRLAFRLTVQEQQSVISAFLEQAVVSEVPPACPVRCKDPLDQTFIDLLAVEAPALLITKDRLVLRCAKRMKKTGGLIVNPARALELLQLSA